MRAKRAVVPKTPPWRSLQCPPAGLARHFGCQTYLLSGLPYTLNNFTFDQAPLLIRALLNSKLMTKVDSLHMACASAVSLLLAVQTLPAQTVRTVEPDIAITNVSVVDVELGRVHSNQTVLVSGGRITAIGTPKTTGMRIVAGRGKFLVPGLFDTHVHVRAAIVGSLSRADTLDALGSYVAFGITGIREAGAVDPINLVKFRRTLESEPAVPRLSVSAVVNNQLLTRNGAKDALDLVRQFAAAGVDGIKIRNDLTNAQMESAIAEARRLGLPSFGHTYDYRRRTNHDFTLEATAWGAAGVMHVLGIAPSTPESEPTTGYMSLSAEKTWLNIATRWLRTSDAGVNDLIARMIAKKVWLEPTLLTEHYMLDSVYYRNHQHNGLLEYPYDTVRSFMPTFHDEQLGQYKLAYVRMQDFVRRFQAAGGIVLAGTDNFPMKGAGLHDELRLLVEAGLPPLAALQAATINAARALGWGGQTGAIKAGLVADLLLVDANPLQDISNLQRISGVFMRGRYFDARELQGLRERAEAQAARRRKTVMGGA